MWRKAHNSWLGCAPETSSWLRSVASNKQAALRLFAARHHSLAEVASLHEALVEAFEMTLFFWPRWLNIYRLEGAASHSRHRLLRGEENKY